MNHPKKRILMVTATAGYQHASIPTAQKVVQQIASDSDQLEVDLVATLEETSAITATTLANYDLLFFANTGELPLDEGQKQALLDFVVRGNGFVGIHSASDTFHSWPDYGDLIGAVFDSHPWTQVEQVKVEDTAHPLNGGLGESYDIFEEFYVFKVNPRPHVHVLQSLDAASVGASGDYPLAWCKHYGDGRVYYHALGHFESTWQDSRFQEQLLAGMRWAAGLLDAPCQVA
jgi:uncharacterized protein